jgi:hypothetical protein
VVAGERAVVGVVDGTLVGVVVGVVDGTLVGVVVGDVVDGMVVGDGLNSKPGHTASASEASAANAELLRASLSNCVTDLCASNHDRKQVQTCAWALPPPSALSQLVRKALLTACGYALGPPLLHPVNKTAANAILAVEAARAFRLISPFTGS